MKVNIPNLNRLIEEKFRGNQTFFAETIGVDRSYLNQVLHIKSKENSPKICNALIKFCESNKLDYKDYVILE